MNTKKVKGFTLIELMVVVAIIAILAAIAIPMIFQYRLSANRAKCVGNMKQIQNAVESSRAAAKDGKASTKWSDYISNAGTSYFTDTLKCPQDGESEYALSEANDPTWKPKCPKYYDAPYSHAL